MRRSDDDNMAGRGGLSSVSGEIPDSPGNMEPNEYACNTKNMRKHRNQENSVGRSPAGNTDVRCASSECLDISRAHTYYMDALAILLTVPRHLRGEMQQVKLDMKIGAKKKGRKDKNRPCKWSCGNSSPPAVGDNALVATTGIWWILIYLLLCQSSNT